MGPIFIVLVAASVLVSLAVTGTAGLTNATLDAARDAAELALKLIGYMALFLGMAHVLRRAGMMPVLARAVRPLFRQLFPEVPDGHPALGAVALNVSANMLGLGNAATPLGIDAMQKLDRLNGRPGTATDAMCLFLAINTSSVALIPSGTWSMRREVGSAFPEAIWIPTLIATAVSTLTGIAVCLLLARLPPFARSRPPVVRDEQFERAGAGEAVPSDPEADPAARWIGWRAATAVGLVVAGVLAMLARWWLRGTPAAVARDEALTAMVPLLLLGAVFVGWSRGVKVYETWVEGAKQGFDVAIRILPFLVVILTALGMFRASGSLDAITAAVGPWLERVGFPAEALPMALVRPLSGSGALAVMVDTMKEYGPDSFVGNLVSTLMGSTETTFYTLAVYGGAVGMERTRHVVPACLAADFAGVVGATAACHWWFG